MLLLLIFSLDTRAKITKMQVHYYILKQTNKKISKILTESGLRAVARLLLRICCCILVSGAQYPHAIFLACMGNHSASLSSAIITILLSSELESDTFSKTFQITPLPGFSTKPFRANLCFVLVSLNRLDVTFACKKCPLFSCQSVLAVSAESVAGAAGLEGSYHSCQITDNLTPTSPTSFDCIWFPSRSLDLS